MIPVTCLAAEVFVPRMKEITRDLERQRGEGFTPDQLRVIALAVIEERRYCYIPLEGKPDLPLRHNGGCMAASGPNEAWYDGPEPKDWQRFRQLIHKDGRREWQESIALPRFEAEVAL